MMAIYDQTPHWPLLGDALASLLRQWAFRPQPEQAPVSSPIADGPVFASLEPYRMRSAAVVQGSILSVTLIFAVIFLIDHPGKMPRWLAGTERAVEGVIQASRSSLMGQDLDTAVQIPEAVQDPWIKLAIAYYQYLPAMKALDIDGDHKLSSRELILAPASLRSLDHNQDGKLDGRECGAAGEPAAFIRRNPVLAVIDADGDGELSASEIRNAAEALRALDRNGDSILTPDEYLPRP